MRDRTQSDLFSFVVIGFILLLCLMLSSSAVNAKSIKLSGSVKNYTDKAPSSGVRIILAPQTNNGEYCTLNDVFSATTDKAGKFSIDGVQAGKYCVFFGSPSDSIDSLKGINIPTSTSKLMIVNMLQADNNKLRGPVKTLEVGE